MHHNILSNTTAFQKLYPQEGWGRLVPCARRRSRTRSTGSTQKQNPVGSLGRLRVGTSIAWANSWTWMSQRGQDCHTYPAALWGLDAPFSISRCLHPFRGEMPKLLLSKRSLTVRLWAARRRGSRSLSVVYDKYQHLFSLVHHHHPWGETNWPGHGLPTPRHPSQSLFTYCTLNSHWMSHPPLKSGLSSQISQALEKGQLYEVAYYHC